MYIVFDVGCCVLIVVVLCCCVKYEVLDFVGRVMFMMCCFVLC